jgi:hypothetical protein
MIKDIIAKLPNSFEINIDYSELFFEIRKDKESLSNPDKKYLIGKLAKYHDSSKNDILKIIVAYSIWEPDEAITEARKKGVFRYKAWGFSDNCAEYLLLNLKNISIYMGFSELAQNFINSKLSLSWMYHFYKDIELKIKEEINNLHKKRIKFNIRNVNLEEALFKELLAYADLRMASINTNQKDMIKNRFSSYTREEIVDSIAYIIFLYDDIIGIKPGIQYIVSSEYVLSDKIKDLILQGCMINQLQEWEVCVDYFNYSVIQKGKEYYIYDKIETFEKSIRLGFIKRDMQEQLFFNSSKPKKDSLCLTDISNMIINKLGNKIFESVNNKNKYMSRYRFLFYEPLFNPFFENDSIVAPYYDEKLELANFAREMIIPYEEACKKQITKNCILFDILLFKRFFSFSSNVINPMLFRKTSKDKVVNSLIPSFEKDELISLLNKFMGSRGYSSECLDLFTYKKNYKLDLFYTPFIKIGNQIIFSSSIVSKSNLYRNSIANSYLVGNQIVNQAEREPLIKECENIFSNKELFQVFVNVGYKHCGKKGEIDVVVVFGENILLIECKAPFAPTSNFEIRTSHDHIIKASKQLSTALKAFKDKDYLKNFISNRKIQNKNYTILTCIVMGNRLFNGYSINNHPVRYLRELDMYITGGIIYSAVGEWRVWGKEQYSHSDLISYLSLNDKLNKSTFNSMYPINYIMHYKSKTINFQSFALNMLKVVKKNDEIFTVLSKDEKLMKELNENPL